MAVSFCAGTQPRTATEVPLFPSTPMPGRCSEPALVSFGYERLKGNDFH